MEVCGLQSKDNPILIQYFCLDCVHGSRFDFLLSLVFITNQHTLVCSELVFLHYSGEDTAALESATADAEKSLQDFKDFLTRSNLG